MFFNILCCRIYIYYFSSFFKLFTIAILNYVDHEDARREESKELFLFQQKTLFQFRSFHLKALSLRVSASFSPFPKVLFPLDLGSSFVHISYRSFHRFIMTFHLSFSPHPLSILCYFATPHHILWGFLTLLSNYPSYLVIPFACSPSCGRPHFSPMLLNFHSVP